MADLSSCYLTLIFIYLYKVFFIFESESVSGGGTGREGDRRSELGSALTAIGLMWGLNSQTVRS